MTLTLLLHFVLLQLENALLQGDPDSNSVQLKLCDFGYSKDELVRLSSSTCQQIGNTMTDCTA